MHAAIEVQEDPEVGGERLLESLRHEAAVPGRQRPVDPAKAVTGRVIANTAGLRRVVRPGAEARRAADLLSARSEQVGDRPYARIHEDGVALGQLERLFEEPKRFAHAQ